MEEDVGEDELDQHEEDVEDLHVVMNKDIVIRLHCDEEGQTEQDKESKKDKLKRIGCIRMNNMTRA